MTEDDGIPTLRQVVRPGAERRANAGERRQQPQNPSNAPALTDAEIEAIARRVMDRYAEALENTIERAIRKALERKANTTTDEHG